ncbi:MAG: EAL domain-containing protein, partial [Kangiellaceae bacterium]|nr:EAL domain-containing protein [Kangiellaceae bacterium]
LTKFKRHRLSKSYSLAALKNSSNHSDLLLIKEHNESYYVADLNNLSIATINHLPCEDCLNYRVTIHGEPPIHFGDELKQAPAYSFEINKQVDRLSISVVFEATGEISKYYSGVSWVTTILLACIFSIILIYTVEKLLNHRRSLRSIIERAIKNQEFKPYYQPIVDSRTNRIVGAEALLTWIEPNGKIIPTGEFINFVEQTGLIMPITSQLIKTIAKDITTFDWQQSDCSVSLNVVPEHLNDEALFSEINRAVKHNGISLSNFSLEITERNEIKNLSLAKRVIKQFVDNGIELKLDDAGTGYGGFSYVQELGISTLKIDKMFVDTILYQEDVKKNVLDAIISFANSSGLSIIAEGVEKQNQVDYLESKGVHFIQGYAYSKPVSCEVFRGLLQDGNLAPLVAN